MMGTLRDTKDELFSCMKVLQNQMRMFRCELLYIPANAVASSVYGTSQKTINRTQSETVGFCPDFIMQMSFFLKAYRFFFLTVISR